MTWKDILKQKTRKELETDLQDALEKWGFDLEFSDFSGVTSFERDGLGMEPTLIDVYDGDEELDDYEKFEIGEAYYRLEFSFMTKYFATGQLNDGGFTVEEFSPKVLSNSDIESAIEALERL